MTLSLVAEVTSHCCVVEGLIAGAAKVSSFSNTQSSIISIYFVVLVKKVTFLIV